MSNDLAHQAQSRARYQSANGPAFGKGQCMLRCRELVDAPAIGDYDGDGSADAEDGWKFAKHKHPTTLVNDIPGGCFIWWGGGSHDNGHVAYADPDQRGMCWSTDIERTGYFDLVPIGLIHTRWGLPLLGWSEDIDGVTVYDATNRTGNQEDDMATPDEIWAEPLKSAGGRHAGVVLGQVWSMLAAQAKAIEALGKALGPTVEAAVKEALAGGVVDVDVTVHDKTGA